MPGWTSTILELVGVGLVIVGVAAFSPPAAAIVAGTAIVAHCEVRG